MTSPARLAANPAAPEVDGTQAPSRPHSLAGRLVRIACLAGILAVSPLSSANAEYFLYSSDDVPKSIPDNNFTGITSQLVVPDSLLVSNLNLIFDELLHESVSDLRISLTSPMGTNVILLKASNEGGILTGAGLVDNFVGTILDDNAPTNLQNAFFDNHVGVYNIDHASVGLAPLSRFNGENAMGTWILQISDRVKFDAGSLNAWSLGFTGASAVPEPSGLALFGIGAAAAVFMRRRRKGV